MGRPAALAGGVQQQDIATGPDQPVVSHKGQAFGAKFKAPTQLLTAKAPGQTVQDQRCQLLTQASIHALQQHIRNAAGHHSLVHINPGAQRALAAADGHARMVDLNVLTQQRHIGPAEVGIQLA